MIKIKIENEIDKILSDQTISSFEIINITLYEIESNINEINDKFNKFLFDLIKYFCTRRFPT